MYINTQQEYVYASRNTLCQAREQSVFFTSFSKMKSKSLPQISTLII
jgi:hypothetical protein